jgi:peptidylprolyl isomerase
VTIQLNAVNHFHKSVTLWTISFGLPTQVIQKSAMLHSLPAVLLGILISSLCSAVHAANAQEAIASMGEIFLSQDQFKSMIETLDPESRQQLRQHPDKLEKLATNEVIRMGVLKEALAKGWDKKPEVQARLQQLREQVIVATYLNEQARAPANYPSESEIRTFYDNHKDSFKTAKQYRLAQIFLSTSNASAEKVMEIASKAKNEDFSALAKKYSDHKESAANGGDSGWLDEAQLLPEIRTQLASMSSGAISSPIKSAAGWHIIKLQETKPPAVLTIEQARPTIQASMRLQKARELEQVYLEKMLSVQPVRINKSQLERVMQ